MAAQEYATCHCSKLRLLTYFVLANEGPVFCAGMNMLRPAQASYSDAQTSVPDARKISVCSQLKRAVQHASATNCANWSQVSDSAIYIHFEISTEGLQLAFRRSGFPASFTLL